MKIGIRIKQRRKELGLSADSIAEKLGVDRTTYYRYESSYIEKLPVTVIAPLANALKTTPAYLMGWDDVTSDEQQLVDTYFRAKSSDKESVRALIKVIDKLLGIDEQSDDKLE